MQPVLKEISPFSVAGFTVRTSNQNEANPLMGKIPLTWGKFFSSGIANTAANKTSNPTVYGVYSDYESDFNGLYTFTAGIAADAPNAISPELHSTQVEGGNYLVFSAQGIFPAVVIQTWTYIWSYFAQHPEIKRSYKSDFELYSQPGEIEIYIGISS